MKIKDIQRIIAIREEKKQILGRASYVKIPPEEPGWRMVTFEIAPLAERTHIPRGPF